MGSLRDFLIDVGRNAYGLGENVASLGSAAIAEPVAGYAAMFDPINGAAAIREGMTYQPRTEAGRMYQQGAAQAVGRAVKPVMPVVDTWQKGVDIAGRYSPTLGALMQTAPTALGVALGAKPTLQAGRQASNTLGAMQARMIANANAPRTLNTGFMGQRGTFAGINALTADKEALEKAKNLIAQGADPEDVWMETGWGRGADGKWRFEIDDSQLRINNVNRNDVYFIGDAVENDLITKAYPKIKDNYLNIGRLDDRLLGGEGMTDDLGDIALHKNLTENGNINTKNLKSTLLHEIQHNIQQREGFARGGSPDEFDGLLFSERQLKDARILANLMKKGKTLDEAVKEFTKIIRREPLNGVKSLVKYNPEPKDLYAMTHDPYEAYRRLAGEVEARMVQNRMDLTPQQRRELYPFDFRTNGYDVPESYQNVQFGNEIAKTLNKQGGKQ